MTDSQCFAEGENMNCRRILHQIVEYLQLFLPTIIGILFLTGVYYFLIYQVSSTRAGHPAREAEPFNAEGYSKIELGMSKAEVLALMEGPPGDYSGGLVRGYYKVNSYGQAGKGDCVEAWLGKEYGVWVYFGPDGLVTGKEFAWSVDLVVCSWCGAENERTNL
jgi:hypothetical protein